MIPFFKKYIISFTSLLYFLTNPLTAELPSQSLENTVKVKACFTPSPEGCLTLILDNIEKAENSIYVQAYSFTEQAIAKALIKAHQRGITVQIILDKSQLTGKGSQLEHCYHKGIPIYIDKISGIAHNKVMIIDERFTITGSYNFTRAAEKRNAENLLVIDSVEIAAQYLKNWYARWNYSYIYRTQQFREGKNFSIMADDFKEWLSNIFVDLQTCFP
jgi:phospholipase D